VLSGNPLWAIPLGRLTASRDHPLFSKTRRPPPVAAVARPASAPIMSPPKPIEPEKPELSLLGTIAGREKIGLFIDSTSKTVVRLKAGENHKGWVLRAVRPRQVELAKGLDSAVLDVPPPDVKVGPASTLAAPAVSPASSSPVGQVLPVSAAKATGALPVAAPAGATIVVQPPVFRPAAEPVNPFPKGRLP
jgi:general secretion pathway protein N